MRTIKKEILKLVETYIGKAEDLESVNESMVPALFEAILDDYSRNVPAARDAEVLNVTTAIVTRLQVGLSISGVAFQDPNELIPKDIADTTNSRGARCGL